MALFLALLGIVAYAIVASRLPRPTRDDHGFDNVSDVFNPLRLLSDPSADDSYDASWGIEPVTTDRAGMSWLQLNLWMVLLALLGFVWWSNQRAKPPAPDITSTAEKIAPTTMGMEQYSIPFIPATFTLKKAEILSAQTTDTLTDAGSDNLQHIPTIDLTPRKIPPFMLKLAEYSHSEGVDLLSALFPGENIQSLHIAQDEYWAGIFFDTYGAAQRAFVRWERKRPQWERYGLEPEVINLQWGSEVAER